MKPTPTSASDGPVDAPDLGRRRFARGGLAAPVVLGSLSSQPVLGAQLYPCTVSGNMSGNASPRGTATVSCRLGDGPQTWIGKAWPTNIAGLTKGSIPTNNNGVEQQNQCATGSAFNGFGSGLVAGGFAESFFCKNNELVSKGTGGSAAASMLQVLRVTTSPVDPALARLGRATVASFLNAYSVPDYPVTPARVIEMFNAVYNGGTYMLDAGRAGWDRATVIWYFESLFLSS